MSRDMMPQIPGVPDPRLPASASKPLVAMLQALQDKCECRACTTLKEYAKDLENELTKK